MARAVGYNPASACNPWSSEEMSMTNLVRSCRLASWCALLLTSPAQIGVAQDGAEEEGPRPTMVGAYGDWLSQKVLGDGPARLSFRTGRWGSLDEWRVAARRRAWER